MEFRQHEAIYLQIADLVESNVLSGKWKPEEKIPSVRELAVDLQVNLNTVMHAYEYLESQGVIYNKRGIGSFVAAKADTRARQLRKEKFFSQDLQQVFSSLLLLEIPIEEIVNRFEQFKAKIQKGKAKKL